VEQEMKRTIAVLAVLLGGSYARADEVFLRGGGSIHGDVVQRTATSVVMEVGPGRMTLPMSRVERIVSATSDLSVARERAGRLAPGDVAGWLALARWAEDRDLLTQAREAYEHVLAVDPQNAEANSALGRVRLAGRWVTAEESYRARGYVPFEGGWVSPEERAAVLAERAAEAHARELRAETEARAREAEARARTAEADARRAEAEAQDPGNGDGIPYPYVYGGVGVYGGGYGGVYGPGNHGGRSRGAHGRHGRPRPVIDTPPPPPTRDEGGSAPPARRTSRATNSGRNN
jgi:hypothetical protein